MESQNLDETLPPFIAKTVSTELKSKKYSSVFIGGILKDYMEGYGTSNGAQGFINLIKRYGVPFYTRHNPGRDRRNILILLHALGIPPEHEVIIKLKEYCTLKGDKDFKYPPDKAISHETVSELYQSAKSTIEERVLI